MASAIFLAGAEPAKEPPAWLEKKLGPVAECIRGHAAELPEPAL
jgi:hypothetical protein